MSVAARNATERNKPASKRTGDVVVVTGASAGLGRAVARAFGERGASVGLLARGRDGLEGAKQDIEAAGGRALAIPTDVAHADEVEAAAEKVEQEFGPITIWVNNAMVSVFSPVKEMKPEEFQRVTEVTYLGQVYGTLAALKRMLPRDEGSIVLVGSALAYRSIPLQSAYCASKHAIMGFYKSLRCELIHDNSHVRLSMVQMPAMNTPQFTWVKSRLPNTPQPVPPIYEPEVGAEAVVWAAYHDRPEVLVAGPTVKAVQGSKLTRTFFPGLLDHYLASTGYTSQQTDEPVSPDRRDNLWQPLPGDHGAHGPFDDRSHTKSYELWASLHRSWLYGAAAGVAGLAAGAALWKKR
jgi:NAD(P)-dependent dehydrogenase (short-subunit alcohol dehydrogenase family)